MCKGGPPKFRYNGILFRNSQAITVMIGHRTAAGLLCILAAAVLVPAHAELPPPLKQLASGVPPEVVQCRDGLVLVILSYDSAVCVREETAAKKGWSTEVPELPDYSGIVAANNGFAIDFYAHSAQKEGRNIVFSPWSISNAFAIAHEGARGDTRDEITNVFGFPEEKHMQFRAAMADLNRPGAQYKLSVANSLWLAEWLAPRDEYVDTAQVHYDSRVESLDLATPAAIETINEWVEENTGGKIKKVLSPGSTDALTALVIANAVYFKGIWKTTFDKSATNEDGSFWVTTNQTVPVPMMYAKDSFRHAETDTHQILEMPYVGDRISMLVLLPSERGGIGALEESLSAESLEEWRGSLDWKRLEVFFPKFSLDVMYNLRDDLGDMGVTSVFDIGRADLSGIAEDGPLYASKAIHKAFINVDERGTEAGATTTIAATSSSLPAFRADHPFVFVIQDRDTGNMLFIGRLADPSPGA